MTEVSEPRLDSLLPSLLNSDPSLQAQLLNFILGVTSSHDGCKVIIGNHEVLASLLNCVFTHDNDVGRDACRALVNISSYQEGCDALLSPSFEELFLKQEVGKNCHLIMDCMSLMTSTKPELAELLCCLLNNLTRSEEHAARVADVLLCSDVLSSRLLSSADEKLALMEHMPFLYANLAQDSRIRRLLLDHDSNYFEVFPRLLKNNSSPVHQSGIVCLIKNCCFAYEEHEWLLGPEVDILSYLLWPLAGPEEFDEEDMKNLPVGLQYLPKDKNREPNKAVRKMVLESLYKLCARKLTREILRSRNVYLILREYEKWEEELELCDMLFIVVNLLIQTEEEIGADFLPGLSIPDEVKTKFEDPALCEVQNETSEEVELIS